MKIKIVLITFLFLFNHTYSQQLDLIGPPGGRVSALAINPHQPDVVFAGTRNNILFRSTDAGESSTAIFNNDKFFLFSSSELTFHPTDPNIVYAGSHKSTDNGDTWERQNGMGDFLTINPLRPNKMYCSILWNTLDVSEDGGDTWSLLYEFKNSIDNIVIAPSDTSVLYTVADDDGYGIYISTNSGISWQQTNFPLKPVICIKVNPNNAQEMWVGTTSGLYKTIDSGENWQLISDEQDINDIAINPENKNIVYFVSGDYLYGSGGVFKTVDGGISWEDKNNGLPEGNNRILYHLENNPDKPDEFYVGTYGYGVYKTTNGCLEWNQTAITKAPVLSLSFHPTNENYIYAGTYDQGILLSMNGGLTWEQLALNLPTSIQTFCRQIRFNPQNNDIVYATAGRYGVLKSTDGGVTWNQTSLIGSFDTWAWSLAVHPIYPDIVYCGQTGFMERDLYRSNDAGITWNNLLLFNNVGAVYKIMFDITSPENIYLCVTGHGFYKSTDNGETWVQSNDGLKTTDYPFVSDVLSVIIGQPNNILYLAQEKSIRKSTDYGNSWFAIDQNLSSFDTSIFATDVAVPPDNPGLLFAALTTGVYITSNSGETWERIFSGSSDELQFDPHNSSRLYITTEAGIFTIEDYALLSVEKPKEKLPASIVLYQNYPNPFNSQTFIKYKLFETGEVIIKILNMLGQEVKSFYNHHNSPGEYSISWDGRKQAGDELSSGVYLYTIKTKYDILTKKLVLLK